jgi:hypothetical protein
VGYKYSYDSFFSKLLRDGYFLMVNVLEEDAQNVNVENEITLQLKFKNKIGGDG